ncbi:hypothetical protein, partial [Thiolapillus sp.]|uniref:hypothetical protein n=1 Tax=Thiolapillus sp. TaxID=2017437 RepID=UPI003AF66510
MRMVYVLLPFVLIADFISIKMRRVVGVKEGQSLTAMESEHEKWSITNQRTKKHLNRAFSLAQGAIGLFCEHVAGIAGG